MELQNDLMLMTEKKDHLQNKFDKADENFKKEREVRVQAEKRMHALQNQFDKLQDNHKRLEDRYALLQDQLKDTERSLGDALDSRQKALSLLDGEKLQRRRLEELAKDLKSTLEEREEEKREMSAQMEAMTKELEHEKGENEKNLREINDLKERLNKLSTKHDKLTTKHRSAMDELTSAHPSPTILETYIDICSLLRPMLLIILTLALIVR